MTDLAPSATGTPATRMRHPTSFKLGLFCYLHAGGVTMTNLPDRWPAHWPDIVKMAQMADAGGLDFLLPIARWKGIRGANQRFHRDASFEVVTHAAALSAYTKHVAVFATVHVPVVHPVFAAKAMVTVDHVSGGRAGLNIVCGWDPNEFAMFGLPSLSHADRYTQGWEWYQIWSRLVAGTAEEFDFDGKFFRNLRGLYATPGAIQKPLPLVLSAASSIAGREFAIKTSDFLFTVFATIDKGREEVADLGRLSQAAGRATPLGCIATCYVVCRKTRAEAEEFHDYYAVKNADFEGVDHYLAMRKNNAFIPESLKMRSRVAGGNGAWPLIGAPADVAEQLIEVHRAGFAGASLSFFDFVGELPLFIDEVLPILKRAGIRGA